MARRKRIQGKSLYQHLTARGNNRQALFHEREDYEEYRSLLIGAMKEFRFEVPSHALMTNHVHELAQFEFENMPEAVEFIHGRYARWFNKKYDRVGHLFQRRYDARVVADERYLHEVGRYIHMNPVSAGLCAAPEDYEWSSFKEYWTGATLSVPSESVLTSGFILEGRFDRDAFRRMTMARSSTFEDESWYAPDEYSSSSEAPTFICDDPLALAIVRETAKAFGMLPGDLRPRDDSRLTGSVRGLALLLLREALPWTLRRIGAALGLRSTTAVARAIVKARRHLEIDSEYRQAADRVRLAVGGAI